MTTDKTKQRNPKTKEGYHYIKDWPSN